MIFSKNPNKKINSDNPGLRPKKQAFTLGCKVKLMKFINPLIIFVFLSINLPAYGSTDDISYKGGFLSGNKYLSLSADGKERYAIGFIDGLLIAPLLGAPMEGLNWLEQCTAGMNSKQIVAILDIYLTDNPEKWHIPMNGLSLKALEKSCNK